MPDPQKYEFTCDTCRFRVSGTDNQAPIGSGMVMLESHEECDPPVPEGIADDAAEKEIMAGLETRKPCPWGKEELITGTCLNCDKEFKDTPITELYAADILWDNDYTCSLECAKAAEEQAQAAAKLEKRESDIERD